MKNALILILSCAITFSCNFPGTQQQKVIDKTFDTPTDSLLVACKDLSGFGDMQIGMSWKEFKKHITLDWYQSWNNNWSGVYGKYGAEIDRGKESEWIDKNFKQLRRYVTDYAVGDMKFKNVVFCFYDDKLVYIQIDPDRYTDEIKQHYIGKYGQGQGSYHEVDASIRKDDYKNSTIDMRTDERRKWMNDRVEMIYFNTFTDQKYPESSGKRPYIYSDEYFEIYSIEGKAQFEQCFELARKQYLESKDESRQSSLNQL